MVAWSLPLGLSRVFGESDLDNGQEPLLLDLLKSLLLWLIDVDCLFLGDGDDLVKIRDLSADYLCNPERSIDDSLSGFDRDKLLILTKEKSESSADILS